MADSTTGSSDSSVTRCETCGATEMVGLHHENPTAQERAHGWHPFVPAPAPSSGPVNDTCGNVWSGVMCGHRKDQHDEYGCMATRGGCNSPSNARHHFTPLLRAEDVLDDAGLAMLNESLPPVLSPTEAGPVYEYAVGSMDGGEEGLYLAESLEDAREVYARWQASGYGPWLERRAVGEWEKFEEARRGR